MKRADAEADLGSKFDSLCARVLSCTRCPRMQHSQRVLNRSAGALDARLMFIGEAPGRLGADGTGIPFHGDKAGHNFESLVRHVGIGREEIFVTNAVLCNPRDDNGNNAPPSRSELDNCATYLRQQIELIEPRIVVTLGAAALSSTSRVQAHELQLKRDVRTAHNWFGRQLIPAYHPGQRAMVHRSFANQLADYQFIAEQLRRLDKRPRTGGRMRLDVLPIADALTRRLPEVSYFALHKLFYLIEYHAVRATGGRLTNGYIVRQKDGPYCTDLHIHKLKKAFADLEIRLKNSKIIIRRNSERLPFENQGSASLPHEVEAIVNAVLRECSRMSDDELKTKVYLTAPMRSLLYAEKKRGINTFNAPIDFSAASTTGR